MEIMKVFRINEAGYTFPELLLVVVIIVFFVMITLPMYRRYSAVQELKNISQQVRDQVRSAQNKAINGIASSTGAPANWVLRIYASGGEEKYETGACPIIEDTAAVGYDLRYTFSSCPGRFEYKETVIPSTLSVSHQYAGETEANMFFASITGYLTVYDSIGNELGDEIYLRISSDDYPEMYVILHINNRGGISEEKFSV
jgi:Tfp pilus assembly major pilin PilA